MEAQKVPVKIIKIDESIQINRDASCLVNQNNDNKTVQPTLKTPSTPSSILNFTKFEGV